MPKHGLLVGTLDGRSHVYFRGPLTRPSHDGNEPPDLTDHDAVGTLRRGWNEREWTGHRATLPTVCSSKMCCPTTQQIEPKTSIDATLANWKSCRASGDMESTDGSHHWSHLERSWVEPGTSEADTPSMVPKRRKLSACHRRWQRTCRHCDAFGSQTPDLPVPNRVCVDQGASAR